MTSWFKFHENFIEDHQVQTLSPELLKFWVNLLCLVSRNNGFVPGIDEITFAMRLPVEAAEASVLTLYRQGMLVIEDGLMMPRDWKLHIPPTTTNAERQKRFRNNRKQRILKVSRELRDKKRNATVNPTVKLQVSNGQAEG